jgi:peptidoglycan hydrolase CwlO-like protein
MTLTAPPAGGVTSPSGRLNMSNADDITRQIESQQQVIRDFEREVYDAKAELEERQERLEEAQQELEDLESELEGAETEFLEITK